MANDEELKQLRLKVQEGKLVVGKDRVLKELKAKRLQAVFVSKNCQVTMRLDLEYYAKLVETPVIHLGQSSEELGVFCKKNFLVSVVGSRH